MRFTYALPVSRRLALADLLSGQTRAAFDNTAIPNTTAEFDGYLISEPLKWAKVVKDANLPQE